MTSKAHDTTHNLFYGWYPVARFATLRTMQITVQLSQAIETRLQAQAHGIEAESYAQSLIETAVRSVPIRPRRSGAARDMNAFFKAMAANSDKMPQLPDKAFTRESFYQDHDQD